jgi:hypothetical protein
MGYCGIISEREMFGAVGEYDKALCALQRDETAMREMDEGLSISRANSKSLWDEQNRISWKL